MNKIDSDIRTKEWAERIGLLAVKEGWTFPLLSSYRSDSWDEAKDMPRAVVGINGPSGKNPWPDFRCRLTEKAAEIWVEDTARYRFGRCCVVFHVCPEPWIEIFRESRSVFRGLSRDTLAQACIHCVQDLLKGQKKRK